MAQWVKNSPAMQETQETRLDPWVGKIPWGRVWQLTPALLPGKSHRQRSLEGYTPMGCKESDTTEHAHARARARTHTHTHTHTHTSSLYTQFNVTVPLLWGRESFKYSGRTPLCLTVAMAFLCHILCFSGTFPLVYYILSRVHSDHRKLEKQIICVSII